MVIKELNSLIWSICYFSDTAKMDNTFTVLGHKCSTICIRFFQDQGYSEARQSKLYCITAPDSFANATQHKLLYANKSMNKQYKIHSYLRIYFNFKLFLNLVF